MLKPDIISYYPCFFSLFACFLLTMLYSASLYFRMEPHFHERIITKGTLCSVVAVMVISILIVKIILIEQFEHINIFELLGLRKPGFLKASILPLLLTIILQLNVICMQTLPYLWELYSEQGFLMSNVFDSVFISRIIVIPIYEEFIFRACMMPLLLQCYKLTTAVIICALIFVFIHTGKIVQREKQGFSLKQNILFSLIDLSYVFLFGAFFALLFVKTGHLIAPCLGHALCNLISPDFFEVTFCYEKSKKIAFIILSVAGILLWYNLLTPLTNPLLYNNDVFLKVINQ